MSFSAKKGTGEDAGLPPISSSGTGSKPSSRPTTADREREALPSISRKNSRSGIVLEPSAHSAENKAEGEEGSRPHSGSDSGTAVRSPASPNEDEGNENVERAREGGDRNDDEESEGGDGGGDEEMATDGNQTGEANAAGQQMERSGSEDPEADYWRNRTGQLRNSKAAAKELTKRIQAAVATKKLDIGELDLCVIPDKVFELEDLRILWAQTNKIEVLPRSIARFKLLSQLRLFGNKLRWLPQEIGVCTALQVLWIQDNLLIDLPSTLGSLGQLKILAVGRNPLRSLPGELQKCKNLKEIETEGLEETLSVPPVEVVKQGINGVFMYLKEYQRRLSWVNETATLDLSSMGIKASTLPLEVTNMTQVTSLNLAKNQMTALSPSIFYMASLTDLDVSECPMLKQLSPEIGSMKQLTRIGTAGTDLTSPPPEVVSHSAAAVVEYLATLQAARASLSLRLNHLELQHVDDACANIHGLTYLSFANNKLKDVSAELSRLVSLQTLELQNNDIAELPRELEYCTALTHVNLSENRLEGPLFAGLWVGAWTRMKLLSIKSNEKVSMLPLALANWTSLEKLDLDPSRFTQPPIEVLAKGARATVDYCTKFADAEGASVTRLELSGYKFKEYPMEVNQLKGLRALLLQYNEMKMLPESITVLKDLRELHLSHNPLCTVPAVLASFTGLRALRVDNTLLDELPSFLGKLAKLRSISAVQNRIVSVPSEFGGMAALTKMNLDSNGLRSLPDSIGKLTALKDLSLTRNKIGWLPTTIGKLSLVEEFRLGFNRLWALPKEIGLMTSLVRLRCGNNLLQELPLEMERVTRLEDLSVNSNQISIIPIVIGNLRRLRGINFDNNPIKSPREDVLSAGSDGLIRYLQKMYSSALTHGLDMCHANLKHFPSETLTVPSLHSLVIDDNELVELPPQVMVLSSLTLLSLQRNRLRKIPVEAGQLTALCRLLLSDNKLSEIPLSLGLASNLHEVQLDNNDDWQTPPPEIVAQGSGMVVNYLHKFGDAFRTQKLRLEAMKLETFPGDVYKFPHQFAPLVPPPLTSVSVSHNKIAELSDGLEQLTALQELLLDENELEALPPSTRGLSALTRISFCRNYFHTFPGELTDCWRLQSIALTGNPLTCLDAGLGQLTLLRELEVDADKVTEPALEVVMQGCQAIVQYLGQINAALSSLSLHVPNFHLVTFPPEMIDSPSHPVPQAAQLKTVSMPNNKLETIPTCMTNLTSMTKLDLSGNRLAKMSVVMGAWQRLQYMDLSGNKLEELPTTIGQLFRLEELRLSHNRLRVLPPYMAKLQQLKQLHLGSNQLEELFPGVEKCTALVTLNVSENRFPCLPYQLAAISTIKTIVLDSNPLTSPPPEIRELGTKAVMSYLARFHESRSNNCLNLDGLGLRTFPLEIVALTGLRALSIANNDIETLPAVIGEMVGLEKLSVDNNKLLQLPAELGAVYTLRELTLSGNELRTPPLEILDQGTASVMEYLKRMLVARETQALDLRCLELQRTPVEVAFMTGLTSLSIENNKLQKLFVGIGQLTLLTELLLDYNELQTLPRTVVNLSNLTKLSIAHNKVRHLSEWLHAVTPLRDLNACDNLLQELPYSLLRLSNLTHLNVDMNPFTDPPREVVVAGQKHIFRYLAALQEAQHSHMLDLSNLGLLRFPKAHCSLTSLKQLSLDYNQLEELPAEIAQLLHLERLTLRENRITHLPLSMGHLKHLKMLEVLGNQMESPPPEVCHRGAGAITTFLSNVLYAHDTKSITLVDMGMPAVPSVVLEHKDLTKLDLSSNAISELPMALLLMSTLTELTLDGNQLTELPEDTGLLSNLRKLSLQRNQLSLLPPSVSQLQLLKTLHLENNQLKELPPELGVAYGLEEVFVKGNNFKIPPPEVIAKGSRHFLDYLRRIVDLQRNAVCDLANMGMVDPELPDYILRQKLVASLLLENNQLQTLDSSVTRLGSLTLLNMDRNRLESVPECIFFLTKLETLRLCENLLTHITQSITRLQALKHLHLANNPDLEFLPTGVGTMAKLQTVDVERCPMRGPPLEVVSAGAAAVVDYLGRIDRSGESLELVLEGFELLSNNDDKLDQHILCASHVTALSLSQNRLAELDPRVGVMLSGLEELSVRGNYLRSLPVELASLLSLTVLHVDQNELREISPWIRSLSAITDLSASHNQLEFLTDAVGELPLLRKLNVTSNKLLSLPPELCKISALTALSLDNNPLRSPPPEVCSEGFGQVMDYLQRLFGCMTTNTLSLSSLSLQAYPVEARIYTNITAIDLGDNLLEELPRGVGQQHGLLSLSVAHNQLRLVHPDIQHLVHLKKLHLPFNRLPHLPEQLSNLRQLEVLNAVENELESLPDHICRITSLTDLRVSHNKLASVSPLVAILHSLQRLNLEHNLLTELPPEFEGLSGLTHLNLSNNRLEALPEGFRRISLLTSLDVSHNALRMLPSGVGCCQGMRAMEYGGNPLTSIPQEITSAGAATLIDYLARLFEAHPPPGEEGLPGAWAGKTRSLDLEGLQLVAVPPYVYGLSGLTELSVRKNMVGELPPEISLLRALKKLNLESNLLRSLPLELCLCPLEELELALNSLEEPPTDVREHGCRVVQQYLKAQYHAKKVGVLDVRGCFLKAMPAELLRLAGPDLHSIDMSDNLLSALPNLRELCYTQDLRVGNNALEHLPDSIRMLSALTTLHVPGNRLASLPMTIVHLTALLTLNIDGNRFSGVPSVVCRLSGLTALSVSGNQIAVLDPDVGHLEQLQELRAAGNGLQVVADELCDCTELRVLDLSSNQLEMLPGYVCSAGHMERLCRLERLDVTRNLLTVLPSGLGLLASTLTDLRYDDFELTQLPTEVLEEGPPALLAYLVQCHETLASRCLDLSGAGFQTLPRHIGEMLHLRELRTSNNHIADLPEWIGALKALEVLRIDHTGIRDLPFSLADCVSLHTLDFDGLSLLSPPRQILNKGVTIVREWLNRLREARGGNRLDLSSLGLDEWPLELNRHAAEGHYDALRRLNLLDNILTELPVEICELSGLVELSAGYNRLDSVHPRVAALTTLTSIYLPYNQLETLPDTLSSLRGLTEVNLDGNRLADVPPFIAELPILETLRLNHNQIQGLPPSLVNLNVLKDFQLCYNQLASLPRTIGYNTALTRLKLSYNNLINIPAELGLLKHLQDLQLTHNQLTMLPAELGSMLPPEGALTQLGLSANYFKAPLSQIVLRGTPATLRFLREQI